MRRLLLRSLRSLSWPRMLTVLFLCIVFSTQILAQPGIFEYWSPERILAGWGIYFAEIAITAAAMLVGFAVVESTTPDGPRRVIALLLALPASAAAGYSLALAVLYAPGFGPGPMQFIGETLRLTMLGAAVALIDRLRRRAEAAAQSIHDTHLARQVLAKQSLEARLRLMEAQIEPHFLFNTLANVQRLFETEPASGAQLLENFKIYLRAALPQMRESRSTMGREAALARAYLEILRARMGERLTFAIDVPAHLDDREFPPMMLITLVENAIKHGIEPSPAGGRILVQARGAARGLQVEVSDTGVGFPKASSGKGVGLANIRARLAALFGNEAALSLRTNDPAGVVACIAVPR
jgi:sensor histidine kinase YesM